MNDKTIKITLVIAAYNRAELTIKCLTSIAQQTLQNQFYEVLIVNNNSTDETESIVSKFIKDKEGFRLINEREQGLSAVRNRGWREANGEYVLFIDNDIQVTKNLLEKVLSAFEKNTPSPIVVGAKILPEYESAPANWWIDDFEIRTWGDRPRFLDVSEARNGFSGGCCAFKKATLENHDGFSTSYGMTGGKIRGGEETNLFNRIHSSNLDNSNTLWYDPDIEVFHWVPNEHLSFFYHLSRSYGFGVSTRENSPQKRHIIKYFLGLFLPLPFLFKRLFQMSKSNNYRWSTRWVILLKDFSWKLGYYWTQN